jgi:hypothetical protein
VVDNPGSAELDIDSLAGVGVGVPSPAAVAAVAAICAWLGVPATSRSHPLAARRAADMTRAIAGSRPPALTTRGLA